LHHYQAGTFVACMTWSPKIELFWLIAGRGPQVTFNRSILPNYKGEIMEQWVWGYCAAWVAAIVVLLIELKNG